MKTSKSSPGKRVEQANGLVTIGRNSGLQESALSALADGNGGVGGTFGQGAQISVPENIEIT